MQKIESANLTAVIKYPGMGAGYYDNPQDVEKVYFIPGHVKPERWAKEPKRMKIKEVDQVVISEVLRLCW